MHRWRAIIFATVLEVLGEPFTLLVTMTSLALTSVAPAFHYHQFGEPTRMARDAGLSALLLGTVALALFAAVRTLRRELESGTASSALSHPVSRTVFFLGKALGVFAALAFLAITVALNSLAVVKGAEIGGELAAAKGDVARLWGPSLVCAVAPLVLPPLVAAALNRFRGCRFTLTANLLTLVTAAAGVCYRFDPAMALRYLPVMALAAAPALVVAAAALAAAAHFRANAAALFAAVVLAAFLPALGNYCLGDALSGGGRVSGWYCLAALAALLPAVGALLAAGVWLFNDRDLA